MGEIRKQAEAEVLFEAMHTGHSVYGTFHANNAEEAVTRLTNPPINVPKLVLPALSIMVVQNRNRRTNQRRTLQIAEITDKGDPKVILQYNPVKDELKKVGEFSTINKTLELYTGLSATDIEKDLQKKKAILEYMVKNNIRELSAIGQLMSKYYRGKLLIK